MHLPPARQSRTRDSNGALKRTLLSAKSIAYADPKTGAITGVLFVRMIERLGIAEEVNERSKIVASRPVEMITKGDADLAVAFASAVVDVPGTQFCCNAVRVPNGHYLLRSNCGGCEECHSR
jgi:ABC-type molybdate transport system substrate-binding protein